MNYVFYKKYITLSVVRCKRFNITSAKYEFYEKYTQKIGKNTIELFTYVYLGKCILGSFSDARNKVPGDYLLETCTNYNKTLSSDEDRPTSSRDSRCKLA